ncbi:hypothetical protein CLOSTMETH_01940 [[Clostridium] methylpentosum DSM 5476]|uniref:Uncharacterized protein n=1 Tax=[Clostridium] methylpentosum DSM 5476 TaxID=537013 RepID=C0EDL2_9FIRM|nr:hypothetical protein CLOSTMETH_01940 [[Clostridium] methylpentosum DSM 5476]
MNFNDFAGFCRKAKLDKRKFSRKEAGLNLWKTNRRTERVLLKNYQRVRSSHECSPSHLFRGLCINRVSWAIRAMAGAIFPPILFRAGKVGQCGFSTQKSRRLN